MRARATIKLQMPFVDKKIEHARSARDFPARGCYWAPCISGCQGWEQKFGSGASS
jgi:hypothetical protein